MAIIGIDFDGTCVTHEYPKIGKDIGAIPILKKLSKKHQLILYTMRSNKELIDAIKWFEVNNIPLYAANNNPEQHTWTSSPKVYYNLYIDDAALGCPLVYIKGGRPYVDWIEVEQFLIKHNLI